MQHRRGPTVFWKPSPDERIAQLMVVAAEHLWWQDKNGDFFDKQVSELVKQYNIGGICLFRWKPGKTPISWMPWWQAKTPILMCIDAEWGLGMRMIDSILPCPNKWCWAPWRMLPVVYDYGKKLWPTSAGAWTSRLNYAPVVDVNNNPDNPVINDRSFEKTNTKWHNMALPIWRACRITVWWHAPNIFPVMVMWPLDSHPDLPVIGPKTKQQLDSLELYPFRQIFKASIGSVMWCTWPSRNWQHTPNKPTSISKTMCRTWCVTSSVTGTTFTDALGWPVWKSFTLTGRHPWNRWWRVMTCFACPVMYRWPLQKSKEAIASGKLSQGGYWHTN